MAHDRTILQIIPAEGWTAVYEGDGTPETRVCVPVACWALVDETDRDGRATRRRIVGIDFDGPVDEFCDQLGTFLFYKRR